MREILFRGKHMHVLPENKHLDGRWIERYLADENYINSPELEGEFLIDTETVCQYTGLTDKNGRKIFEGDILYNHYDEKFPEEETMSVIVWDRFGWGIKYRDVVGKLDDFDCKNGEVTGNIFDNADLIRR